MTSEKELNKHEKEYLRLKYVQDAIKEKVKKARKELLQEIIRNSVLNINKDGKKFYIIYDKVLFDLNQENNHD